MCKETPVDRPQEAKPDMDGESIATYCSFQPPPTVEKALALLSAICLDLSHIKTAPLSLLSKVRTRVTSLHYVKDTVTSNSISERKLAMPDAFLMSRVIFPPCSPEQEAQQTLLCLFVCVCVCPDLTASFSASNARIILRFGTQAGIQVRLIVLNFRYSYLINNR